MKHSVKKDLFLRELYKYKFNDQRINIQELADQAGIKASYIELLEICKSLRDLNLIFFKAFNGGTADAKILSSGVEYCESDSFTYRNSPITTNTYITIDNSPNTTVVNGSKDIQINAISELQETLEKVCASIQIASELGEELQKELIERVSEIQESINNSGKVPKYGFRDLINLGASTATLAQYLEPLKYFL